MTQDHLHYMLFVVAAVVILTVLGSVVFLETIR